MNFYQRKKSYQTTQQQQQHFTDHLTKQHLGLRRRMEGTTPDILELARLRLGWLWSTTTTYAEAALSTTRDPQGRWKLSRFLKRAKAHATVERHHCAKPVSESEMHEIRIEFLNPVLFEHRTRLLIEVAYTFAQRPSDVAQWDGEYTKARMRTRGSRHRTKFLVLVFRRGKTIGATGPWTIHLDFASDLAQKLRSLSRWARKQQHMFPFMPFPTKVRLGKGNLFYPTDAMRTKSRKATQAVLQQVNPALEIKSIRRGGAQRLAALGFTHEEIREHFTHHTSLRTLREYLGYGMYSTSQALLHQRAEKLLLLKNKHA